MGQVVEDACAARAAVEMKRPTFGSLMRGEWLKITRQRSFWVMLALIFDGFALYALVERRGFDLAQRFQRQPLEALLSAAHNELFLLRVSWGLALIFLTARLIGLGYSSGATQLLQARGVGRWRLLLAQLSVLGLIALAGALFFFGWASLLNLSAAQSALDALALLKATGAPLWRDLGSFAVTTLLSLGVSIALTAAVTTLTRSRKAGLSVSAVWFVIDSISMIFLVLAAI
jgi:hypothetical protein